VTAPILFRPAVPADWLGPKVGGHLAPFLYSSREPSELSQCLCHDDSTINIVVVIIIIILIRYTSSFAVKITVNVRQQFNINCMVINFTYLLVFGIFGTIYAAVQ